MTRSMETVVKNNRLIYVQEEGVGKGTVVEIMDERGKDLRLKDVESGFEYTISIKSFQLGYKRVDDVAH